MVRIGGLASGMDTDTIIKDLMKAERIPFDKLKQKKQILEWQRDDYRAMNTLLLNFRSELTTMKLSSTYRARGTTSTDESKVTATASSAASLASYSISKVDQLASAASKVNTEAVSKLGNKIDATKSLAEIGTSFATGITWQSDGVAETQTVAATVEGTSFKLTLKDGVNVQTGNLGTMNVKVDGVSYQVVNDFSSGTSSNKVMIDSQGNLTFNQTIKKDSSIKVDYVASRRVQELTITAESNTFTLSTDANHRSSTVTDIKVTTAGGVENYTVDSNNKVFNGMTEVGLIDANGKFTFTNSQQLAKDAKVEVFYKQDYINFNLKTFNTDGTEKNENFNISGTDSLNSTMSKVNESTVGVTMFYDSVTDKMTLTRKETGDFNKSGQEIITSGDFLDNVLNFSGATEIGGSNSKFTINGLETERTSNTFEISGVTFTIKKTFSDAPATVNISNNSTQIFDNIKGFVTKYNELISKIQGELQEERYKSYNPLTDEEREGLSEKQQEQWEEKAKSGMLRRDPVLSSILSKMRTDFGNPVSNEEISPIFKQLASIGIKTSSNYQEGGKLIIDEAELKKAIEADPASIEKLFSATGTTSSNMGIAHRLTETINQGLDKLRSKAGNSFSTNRQFEIGKLLDDVDKKIDIFNNRLTRIEDRYWKQFTAMEKAIQRSNEQMAQLINFSG
ncbi:flagellar filament capping protein FliD [Robertmurraya sp. GLU-23]